MKKGNNKQRIDWIDSLRGLAMFFVVWGHFFISKKRVIRKYIYSFHMPLFFFISGLTFKEDNKLSFKDYAKKKAKSLIIPYFIINLIAIISLPITLKLNIATQPNLFFKAIGIFYSHDSVFPIPASHTWFILALYLVELLFYGLKKLSKNDDINLFKMILLVGLIGYAESLSKYKVFLPWHISSALTGVVFYFLGYAFLKYSTVFKNIFSSKYKMFLTGGVLGMIGFVAQYYNTNISMNANKIGSIILFYISSICTIFALILFVRLFLNKSFVFRNVGLTSIFYIGYQYLPIFYIMHNYPNLLNSNLNILLLSIIVFLTMLPIAMFVNKYLPWMIGKFKPKKQSI